MLLEICCKCGFVHKDDRIIQDGRPYRAYKPHYHWTPVSGELKQGDTTLHCTICVACCSDRIDWKEFAEQHAATPEKYKVKGSLNAPLPERFVAAATELYTLQATYFKF